MLRVLVYGFAAVSAIVATGVVGLYIYLARLPVDQVLDKGREYFGKQVDGVRRFSEIVRESRKSGEEIPGPTEEIRRVAEKLVGSRSQPQEKASPKTSEPPGKQVEKKAAPIPVKESVKEPVGKPEGKPVSPGPAEQTPFPSEPPAQTPATAQSCGESQPKETVNDKTPGKRPEMDTNPFPDAAAAPDFIAVHKVSRGETLFGISQKYYHTGSKWKRIAEANCLKKPYRITPGMALNIPPKEGAVKPVAGRSRFPVVVSGKDIKPVSYKGGRGL